MARLVNGFHSFTFARANGMNHAFAFSAKAGPYFTDLGGMKD